MLFHEIYSTYFQTVAKILAEAVEHPLTTEEINAIIQDYAFEESILNIPKSLGMAHWQLLKEDGTTILRKNPTMPLTILQKRWINAIALDPRIRLFTDQPVVFLNFTRPCARPPQRPPLPPASRPRTAR